jgi:hypothetical protein
MRRGCKICDGRLQRPGSPLHFVPHLKVWACAQCADILADVPPKESLDAH